MRVADPRPPRSRPAPKPVPRGPKRSPRQYEEELRRQELLVSRALMQAVPTERRPKTSELAAARRALSHALHELRQLHQELEADIKHVAGRERPGVAGGGRARQTALDQYEAARDAIEEVLERWERRRDQLSAEIERRSGRRPSPGPSAPAGETAPSTADGRRRSRPPRPRSPARGPRDQQR